MGTIQSDSRKYIHWFFTFDMYLYFLANILFAALFFNFNFGSYYWKLYWKFFGNIYFNFYHFNREYFRRDCLLFHWKKFIIPIFKVSIKRKYFDSTKTLRVFEDAILSNGLKISILLRLSFMIPVSILNYGFSVTNCLFELVSFDNFVIGFIGSIPWEFFINMTGYMMGNFLDVINNNKKIGYIYKILYSTSSLLHELLYQSLALSIFTL